MNNKIKVLHVLWRGHSGGAERFTRDIVVYSDKNKFQHEVCFLSEGGWLADQMVKSGIKVYYLGMKRGFSFIAGIRLLKIMKVVEPQIIHNHIRNYLASILILCFSKVPRIYFEHGGNLIGNNSRREIVFYNCFGRLYDAILANSSYVKNKIIELTKVNPKKIKVFYMGIDPDKYKSEKIKKTIKIHFDIPEDNKVIGVVGRLIEAKGMDDFIKVAAEINKLYKKCSFVIVGDGYLKPALERMSSENKIGCHFLGDRSDVADLLNIFDVFLITSRWEPFGLVVLEAMAARVPVVGFAVPGMKEIIEKGGGGLLLEERNCHKLAEIVVDLLEDKERYNKLSDEGCANVWENFDIRNNIKKLEEEYLLLIES